MFFPSILLHSTSFLHDHCCHIDSCDWTDTAPLAFTLESRVRWTSICACRYTAAPPFCDGKIANLRHLLHDITLLSILRPLTTSSMSNTFSPTFSLDMAIYLIISPSLPLSLSRYLYIVKVFMHSILKLVVTNTVKSMA